MSKITPFLKSQVIHKYLHALSMNEIVKETSLSKGTVHSIIQNWRSNIGGTNIEEIRAFTSEIRKSGITIGECAQGHRIIQLLKKCDINDEFEVSEYEAGGDDDLDLDVDKSGFLTIPDSSTQYANRTTNSNEIGNKKSTKIENNQIIYFLDHIYKNCKMLGITPNIMTEWIEDLLSSFNNFATESDKDNDHNDTTSSSINNAVEKKEND